MINKIEILEKVSLKVEDAFFVAESEESQEPQSPKPIVFEKYKDIEKDLDFSIYNDGDIIGYDLKGSKYSVSKTDAHVFINTDSAITPWGEIIGANKIPQEILEQIQALNKEEQEEIDWTDKTDEPQETDTNVNPPDISTQNKTTPSPIMETMQQMENYTIQSDNDIGIASGKTKYNLNITAIKLLKKLEAENLNATADEQKTLAQFSGWGGIPQAFAHDNDKWTNEYKELKELLSENEYDKASASTLNAHYTGSDIIGAMYKGVKRLGFKGGNIIDPALGTGHFMGKLPEDLKENSKLYGVELDDITARIATQLYPKTKIEKNGYEETKYPDNFFDLAISNVPFGNYGVHDLKHNKKNLYIHDYFFAKTLDKVKPNGVIAFITSKGTMDKANPSFRKYLAERAELLGAIRLPNNAFKASANTEVTTDIIFLKKRDKLIEASDENWIYTGYHETGRLNENGKPEQVPLNQYFIDHPDMLMGEMHFDKSMYGNEKETALFPFSKPENLTLEQFFTQKTEELNEKFSFNVKQKIALKELENLAKEKGFLDSSLFKNENGYFNERFYYYREIFNGNTSEIIERLAWENKVEVDKSEIPLKELLDKAIRRLPRDVVKEYATLEDLEEVAEKREFIAADPTVKNFSFTVVDDKIYQREDSIMYLVDVAETAQDRIKALIELREATKNIIDLQLDGCSDEALGEAQKNLNKLYENFTLSFKPSQYKAKKFQDEEHKGRVNDSRNNQLFSDELNIRCCPRLKISKMMEA